MPFRRSASSAGMAALAVALAAATAGCQTAGTGPLAATRMAPPVAKQVVDHSSRKQQPAAPSRAATLFVGLW